MTERKDIQQPTRETSPKQGFHVEFHGYFHKPLNLQAVSHVREGFETILLNSERALFYWEMAGQTNSGAKNVKRVVNEKGVQGAILHFTYRGISDTEIERHKQKINEASLRQIVDGNLLPSHRLQDFFIAKELDDLARTHDYDFDCEGHSSKVLEITNRNSGLAETYTAQMLQHWQAGEFDAAIAVAKRGYEVQNPSTILRDKEVVEDLKQKVRSLRRNGKGDTIFLLFGSAHASIVTDLARKIDPKETFLSTSVQKFVPEFDHVNSTYEQLRNNEPITDERVAKIYLIEVFAAFMEHAATAGNIDIEDFARNYEDLDAKLQQTVAALDLDEIKRICEKEKDVVNFIQDRL